MLLLSLLVVLYFVIKSYESISGALSGALVDKIGLLNMSILASLLGPCGFISSFFSTSLEFLYCSIGIVGGIV